MKRIGLIKIVTIVLILSLLLIGCSAENNYISDKDTNKSTEDDVLNREKLLVHFIDVGQGDSIFIQFPDGRTTLIDGGTRESEDKVLSYLNSLGIEKIDYLIATHPHEDHIGGLPGVVRNFDIGKIYMPNKTANTKIFEELLTEIKNKGLNITLVDGFDTIIDEDNIRFVILGPNGKDYSETNDYSIVTKLEYGENSFIFTGDMEREAEIELIENGYDLKSDVLKVGHHGSSTSSSEEFLKEVDPDYSVISLGKDNDYGHPHKETIERLNKIGTKIYRTDELGDIVIASDGENLTINESKMKDNVDENLVPEKGKNEVIYIGNKNTKIFHTEECGSLPKKDNQVIFYSYDEAINAGYKPHEKCIKE